MRDKADRDFIWSLMPDWIKAQPAGLCPTMYGTSTVKGDREACKRVREILFGVDK
jgi:hypothetical protein